MKTSDRQAVPHLVILPIAAALIGIIFLFMAQMVRAQSPTVAPNIQPHKGQLVRALDLHVSTNLLFRGNQLLPNMNIGIRGERHELAFSMIIGTRKPLTTGGGVMYSFYPFGRGKVLQPYFRLRAERLFNSHQILSIDGPLLANETRFAALIGTKIYPFRNGFHFDIGMGVGHTTIQPTNYNQAKFSALHLSSHFGMGFDLNLGRRGKASRRALRHHAPKEF
ncbi:MAG: hypothetical protein AAF570_21805 [Bacteroidota bacterium]